LVRKFAQEPIVDVIEAPAAVNPLVAEAAPRLQLVVQGGPQAGATLECRRVVTLIGSREGCKIRLRHRQVSPVHLALVNDGAQVLAVDLISSRGTLLNGLKMEHERLSDGDVLTIKPWEIRVHIEERAHEGNGDLPPFGLEPTPHLVVLEHVETGRILQPNRELVVVGRRNGCDIVIAGNRVSRVHGLLLNYFGRPAIFDLLSTNGTLVNDEHAQFQMLNNEDVLTIDESQFRVRLVGSPVTERVTSPKVAVETTVELSSEGYVSDMVDIAATETNQPWRIAETFEKVARKR
jgi:pSer/pThr/pTyr-binding forkhead associated (FHA) protein